MLDKFFPLYALIFLLTAIFTVMLERILIPKLKAYAKQPIYEDGPKWHMKKSGTPTMGGLAFLIASTLSLGICSLLLFIFELRESAVSILLSLMFALGNALVGIIDDKSKLKKKKNEGLTPSQKLALQFLTAILYITFRIFLLDDDTTLSFSFGEVDLGFIYYPLVVIVLLGIINCANLTDGIDGLASSVAFSIGVSLMYISAALNAETAAIAAVIIGASVGFLFFNIHPAKIFMGDTGSLFFGALIASCALTLNNPILICFIAGVYVIEGISVTLQVFFYKLTKKRIFKMAPLHHHFEKCGWSENRICIVAIMLTFIFSIPAYIFYLP